MSATGLPRPPRPDGRVVDVGLHLLDRQVLDRDEVPLTVVGDLELADAVPGGAPPQVVALLAGPVLGARVFGGRAPSSRWHRLPWRLVGEVGVVVRVAASAEDLDVDWVERWVRDQIIARIPGGRRAP